MRNRHKLYLFGYALIIVMVSGCAEVQLTNVVRVKDGEVQFRECKMTVWTVLIAAGFKLDNCQDKFIKFGKMESAIDADSRIASAAY